MREYKFRGKRLDNGELVFGFGAFIWEDDDIQKAEIYSTYGVFEVDPESVGQYTGLSDRNGKGIYEGDILDGCWVNPMSQEKIVRFYKVVYEKAVFYAQLIGHHPYGTTLLYFENKNSQVAGNIFDNPEMLEVPHE